MVGRTISEQVKKTKVHRKINSLHQEAVNEYLQEQQKPEGVCCGLQPIAAKHKINFKTLSNLAKGN
jgi:hypothetical protein